MPCRISRSGFCNAGLPVALLPQHHLRCHRQCYHLCLGGGAIGSGATSSKEEECAIAPQRKPPTPSPAPAALQVGDSGQRTCLTSILFSISTLQLSTQPPAAHQLVLLPRSPTRVATLVLTGSAGRQVGPKLSVMIGVLQNYLMPKKVSQS